jgi:hypothetical protein
MKEQPELVIKWSHLINVLLLLVFGTVAVAVLSIILGGELLAISLPSGLALCGIYILGFGLRYIAQQLLVLKAEISEMKGNAEDSKRQP